MNFMGPNSTSSGSPMTACPQAVFSFSSFVNFDHRFSPLSSKLGASPHGILSGSSPPVGSLPKPFPPFQHPSHQLLEENGFRQQK